jgi:hypothetical protein
MTLIASVLAWWLRTLARLPESFRCPLRYQPVLIVALPRYDVLPPTQVRRAMKRVLVVCIDLAHAVRHPAYHSENSRRLLDIDGGSLIIPQGDMYLRHRTIGLGQPILGSGNLRKRFRFLDKRQSVLGRATAQQVRGQLH